MSQYQALGQQVLWFDENRFPHVALIAYIPPANINVDYSDLQPCNLHIITPRGRVSFRENVKPAYHDGIRWRIINRFAPHGTVPREEYEDAMHGECSTEKAIWVTRPLYQQAIQVADNAN